MSPHRMETNTYAAISVDVTLLAMGAVHVLVSSSSSTSAFATTHQICRRSSEEEWVLACEWLSCCRDGSAPSPLPLPVWVAIHGRALNVE